MEWNEKEEKFLSSIEKQCNDLHAYYSKEYLYFMQLSKKFNIPILVVSAINALTAIALNDYLEQRYVSILNAVLSAGTGVLGSIQLYLKLNERMTNAQNSSITFRKLALAIAKELSIETKDRVTDGKTFLNEIYAEFNTTIKQGNPISSKLRNHLKLDQESVTPSSRTPEEQSVESVAYQLLNLNRV
jgi:hypothetical protein